MQEASGGRASEASPAAPRRLRHRLSHPTVTPPPPPSMEKLSSTQPVPGAKRAGDHCFK